VPIVPCVSVGAHESIIVLTRGEGIARMLGLSRFRLKVYPLVVAPPFGVMPGAAPALPLPSKVTVELGPAIDWRDEYGPEAADDDDLVCRLYDQVVDQMQATLDRLASERRLPIIG
jgi:1-acyl-sn-glycerol-3-phosphate acyltransferase